VISGQSAKDLDWSGAGTGPAFRTNRISKLSQKLTCKTSPQSFLKASHLFDSTLHMSYTATKQHVANRGIPPDDFLDQLVGWGKTAADEIFAPNDRSDVYSSVMNTLGPWEGIPHRRAVMLEVMRVL